VATDAEQPGQGSPGRGGAPLIPQQGISAGNSTQNLASLDLNMLHRRAQEAIAEELPPGETLRLVIHGRASSAILATDSRAFVFKTGTKAGLPFSARLKEFEFESVLRVDLRESGPVPVIVIHAPLKIGFCSSYWADSRDDPWKARNAIPVEVEADAKADVAALSQLLERFQCRSLAQRSARATDQHFSPRDTPDVMDRIATREGDAPATQIRPVPLGPTDDVSAGPVSEDCPRCGTELSVGWLFCPRCGAPASVKESGARNERRRGRR
jgi:hypothetical protein